MENPSQFSNFFNDISLAGLEGLAQIKPEDISSKLKLLEETFEKHIEELRPLAVGNIYKPTLLGSTDEAEFILRALVDNHY